MQKLPQTIDEHIAARHSVIAECRALRGAATLRELAGEKEAAKEIAALDLEITEHERVIARLEDAKSAQAALQTKEGMEERRRAIKTAAKDIARLDKEIEGVVTSILKHLEAIAPLSAQLTAAMNDRDEAVWPALRAGLSAAQVERRFGSTMFLMRFDGQISHALASALGASGLGQNRLHLHNVQIPFSKPYPLHDLPAAFGTVRERVQEALGLALDTIDQEAA